MAQGTLRKLRLVSAIAILGAVLACAPALAGNGNGNGGGNSNKGGNSQSHGQGHTRSDAKSVKPTKSAAAPVAKKPKFALAKTYGKLNGFLHASPAALAKASPKSAVGKVAKVYAGLLNNYLSPAEGTTAPTAEEVAAALAAAANKPLTAEVIKAVNDRLLATNPELAANLTASGKTPQDLADEIAAAL